MNQDTIAELRELFAKFDQTAAKLDAILDRAETRLATLNENRP